MSIPFRRRRKKQKPLRSMIRHLVNEFINRDADGAWAAFAEACKANPNGYVSMPVPGMIADPQAYAAALASGAIVELSP